MAAQRETDPDALAAVLPPPLKPTSRPLGRVNISGVDLPGHPLGAGSFAVAASHGGVDGWYLLVMPMAHERALGGGREVSGEALPVPGGEAAPHEYLDRQVFIRATNTKCREPAQRYVTGVDSIRWGSDYPHEEGTYPYSREGLRSPTRSPGERRYGCGDARSGILPV